MKTRNSIILVLCALACAHTAQAAVSQQPDTTASSVASGVKLGEVVVYGSQYDFGLRSSQMSAVNVGRRQIAATPVFLGEPDVLKTLQRFPGVQTSNVGTAGIFVRGGDYDQNLITLDGSPLYNAEHMKGFVGAINPDVVQSIGFYRGAFPARYGSRLSSVIDVGIKAGDFDHYHGLLSIGMLSGRLQAEGPIVKGRTSFSIAARLSYFDLMARPLLKKVYDKPGAMQPYEDMQFYDINAKIVHKINGRNRLSAVLYYGRDNDDSKPTDSHMRLNLLEEPSLFFEDQYDQQITRKSSSQNNWHNLVSSLYWTTQLADNLRLNTNLSYSLYNYRLTHYNYYDADIADHYRQLYHNTEEASTTYKNDISDLSLAIDATYGLSSSHQLRAGLVVTRQQLKPITSTLSSYHVKRYLGKMNEIPDKPLNPEYFEIESQNGGTLGSSQHLTHAAAYAEDDFSFLGRFKLNYGLRLASYFVPSKTYLSLEPRLALRYLATDQLSVKASYSRMAQGLHRLVSGNLVAASDIWVPITKNVPLMRSNIYGLGVDCNLPWQLELSVEGYYKTLSNVIDYRDGMNYASGTGDWQDMIAVGKGRSYGFELLLERKVGNTTGWVSYTWSKALRTFDRPGQEIDAGSEFYASTDRRNNLSATIMQHFDLSKRWMLDLSCSWTYQTGRRGTIADTYIMGMEIQEYGLYEVYGDVGLDNTFAPTSEELYMTRFYSPWGTPHPYYTYAKRNDFKLPDVHHLDLMCTLSMKSRLGTTSLGLSIYNVYNHMNIGNVYVGYDKKRLVLKGICPFPFMPSLIITQTF